MTSAAPSAGVVRRRGMPWHRQIGRGSALACLSRRSRSLFARGDGDLPLPKLVKNTMLTAKSPVSGECRVNQKINKNAGKTDSQPTRSNSSTYSTKEGGDSVMFMKRIMGAAALGAALMLGSGLLASPAQAGYIVTLKQVGGNVVATGSGRIDL